MILPDADRPGRAHAQKVAKAIHGVAASVRILDLFPDRHDGSDVSDCIVDDTAGVRLAKEAKEAPLWMPSGPATSAVEAPMAPSCSPTCTASWPLRRLSLPGGTDRAHLVDRARARDGRVGVHAADCISLPEPGSGKTRALEISEMFVPLPVEAVNVTPAYLFRKVGPEEAADDPL